MHLPNTLLPPFSLTHSLARSLMYQWPLSSLPLHTLTHLQCSLWSSLTPYPLLLPSSLFPSLPQNHSNPSFTTPFVPIPNTLLNPLRSPAPTLALPISTSTSRNSNPLPVSFSPSLPLLPLLPHCLTPLLHSCHSLSVPIIPSFP